jgi:hypothetical protein
VVCLSFAEIEKQYGVAILVSPSAPDILTLSGNFGKLQALHYHTLSFINILRSFSQFAIPVKKSPLIPVSMIPRVVENPNIH